MESVIGTPQKLLQTLKSLNQEKVYELKEHHKRRSKSQNAYAWELIGQLADVLRVSKEEMYFEMLKSYGQSMLITLKSSIEPSVWLKYYEVIDITSDESKIVYRWFKGSSMYDSREMSIFIDGIIQECENVGISTLTPDEIAMWKLV